MTKILVLSDIHIPTRMIDFPFDKIDDYAKVCDFIFGLGDYINETVIDIINSYGKKTFLVSGNMDNNLVKIKLPARLNVKIEDINIGLIHGWGAPMGIRKRIMHEFTDVNLICYGHTHEPYFNNENGIYFFNPGSLSNNIPQFGMLKIKNSEISADFI